MTLADVTKKRAKTEEKIFEDASSDEEEMEDMFAASSEKKAKLDTDESGAPVVAKGSYFAAVGASSAAQGSIGLICLFVFLYWF